MKFTKHKSYVHIKLEGLSSIPESWKYNRIKNIGTVRARVGWKALKASEYVTQGYFFLSTPNIKERVIDYKNVNYITFERYIESPEIMLRENDILLTKDGSTLGIANIVEHLPAEGTVNSSIAVLRFNKKFHHKYFFYLILSDFVQNAIKLKKDGMGVPHLFQKDINNLLLLIPPINEQKSISIYLDKKTLAIERKLFLLETKVKYYKELGKTIIDNAVCHGLNKKVKLIDSGIDWIGKTSPHWSILRVDELFINRSEKISDATYVPLSVSMNGIVPQMEGTAKTKNNDNRKKVLKGDFVINSRSDRRGASGFSSYDGSVSVISIVLKPRKKINTRYYHYFFRSNSFTEEFYRNGKGIVDDLWATKYSAMKILQICHPPLEEQIAIGAYLDSKVEIIENIIKTLTKQIDKFKQFRKSLINEISTGKIMPIE